MGNSPAKIVSRIVADRELAGQVLLAVMLASADCTTMAVATSQGIGLFSLATGASQSERCAPPSAERFVAAVHSPESLLGNVIIVADSRGLIHFVNAWFLTEVASLDTHFEVTQLVMTAPDLVFSGHITGNLQVWHLSSNVLQHSWEGAGSAVRVLIHSAKSHAVVVVFEDSAPLHIYMTDALDRAKDSHLLEGACSPCCSATLIDRKNLVAALTSPDNRVYVWDLLTHQALLTFELPQVSGKAELGTKLGVIDMKGDSDLLIIGMTGGQALISQLTLDHEELTLTWAPLRAVNALGSTGVLGSCSFIGYDARLDVLTLGLADSSVTLVSEFFQKYMHSEEI